MVAISSGVELPIVYSARPSRRAEVFFRSLVQARRVLEASLGHDLGDAAPDGVRDLPVILRRQPLEVLLHLLGDHHADQDVVLLSHGTLRSFCLMKLFSGKRTLTGQTSFKDSTPRRWGAVDCTSLGAVDCT